MSSEGAVRPLARRRTSVRRVALLGLLAVAAGLAIAAVITANRKSGPSPVLFGDATDLDPGVPVIAEGGHHSIVDATRRFSQSVWISNDFDGRSLDRTEFDCHGGRVKVTWQIGDLEPVGVNIGISLTVRLDGATIAGAIRGSAVDTWGDDPMQIVATAPCPAGRHAVDLYFRNVDPAWGFPYVVNQGDPPDADPAVMRGFIIEEVW